MNFAPSEFLDLSHTAHRSLFDKVSNVWEALPLISSYLQFRLQPAIRGRQIGRPFISNAVYIGEGTVIEQGAMVKGPVTPMLPASALRFHSDCVIVLDEAAASLL